MGASFCTMTVAGDKSRAEVRDAFIEEQMNDRHNNGHSYSGGLGMASGLKWHNGNGNLFADEQSALTYLEANCVKWEEAMAVQYRDGDKVRYLIGAWCAS